MLMPDLFALVRDSDNKILGPAGPDYVPVQNKEAFDFFKKFAEAGSMTLETAGVLQGGRRVWVLAKLVKEFELPGGDHICTFLLFSSPHIWGRACIIKFVTVRVVCMNTFTMAMNDATFGKPFKAPHIRPFDSAVAQEAIASFAVANKLFEGFEASAKRLADTKIDGEVVIRYIADIVQPELIEDAFGKNFYKKPKQQQALELALTSQKVDPSEFKRTAYDVFNLVNRQPGADLASSKETMWGAFNAVTYHADHCAGSDRDIAVYNSWFGSTAVRKTVAFERALQIAQVVNPA
jgi:phage/plasmid-like protein (TIGR03299 family)